MSRDLDPGSPVLDPHRLHQLRRAGVLDTPAEAAFDRATTLVRRLLDVPLALVSFVDRDRQFFKSRDGAIPEPWMSARQTPLSHSFCRHVVESEAPLVIEDAHEAPLVCDNPAVADLGVVAYAGMPITAPDGSVLGSLCAVESSARQWTEDDLGNLELLAGIVSTEVALRLEVVRQREAFAELDLAKRTVERAGRARETFLATMSHELRTPLSVIAGNAELLSGASLEHDHRELARAIEHSARQLGTMIARILREVEDASDPAPGVADAT